MLTQHKNKIQPIVSLIICIIGSCLVSSGGIWNVNNPTNSWSSVCYALPNAPLSIKGPLLTLSIASFGLWAQSTPIVNFIDVTCIFWVIIVVSLSLLPKAKHKWRMIYIVDTGFIVYIVCSIGFDYSDELLYYYNVNLVPITGTIMILNMFTLGTYYAGHTTFLFGSALLVVGFMCKIATIYFGHYWGTSIFHTLTAVGIAVLLPIVEEGDPLTPVLIESVVNPIWTPLTLKV
jgi:hypothetical protein